MIYYLPAVHCQGQEASLEMGLQNDPRPIPVSY